MAVLGRRALGDGHAERRAQHVRLHVVGGEAVAGEQHVDPAVADQPGDVGRGAGVHDRRPAHGQHPAATLLGRPDPAGHLGGQQGLGLLGRHVGVHELERRRAPGLLGDVHAHALVADDDALAGADPVHRHGADPVVVSTTMAQSISGFSTLRQ